MSEAALTVRRKSVLVVEDDEATRTLLVRALGVRYLVSEAPDGEAASRLLDEIAAPDVIVCDVMMPNMDGVELTKLVKSRASLKKVPVLILSAKGDAQTKIRGISAGARHYMTKPFSMKELVDRVIALAGDAP